MIVIINQAITTGDQLKVAKVVPIFKKNIQTDVKNYRSISVLPTISKIFENVMQTQLMEYLTSHNLLASQQYGFRSNRSTELATLELMDRNVNFMNQNYCPIYLDLSLLPHTGDIFCFVLFYFYYKFVFFSCFINLVLVLLINIVYYYKIMCFLLNVMPWHIYVILYFWLLLLFSLFVLCKWLYYYTFNLCWQLISPI